MTAADSTIRQTLTGGNGRSDSTGETFYYQFDVPPGRPELNASVTLADNPNNVFDAWLVSPSGEAQAFAAAEAGISGICNTFCRRNPAIT